MLFDRHEMSQSVIIAQASGFYYPKFENLIEVFIITFAAKVLPWEIAFSQNLCREAHFINQIFESEVFKYLCFCRL